MSTRKSMTLSVGDEEKLIDHVELYPELYNISSEKYKRIQLKTKRWERIGDALGIPSKVVRAGWAKLLKTYRRKKAKGASGSAAKRESKWPHMDRLTFLDEVPATRATRSSIGPPQQAARERRKVSCGDGLVRDEQKELAANGEIVIEEEWDETEELVEYDGVEMEDYDDLGVEDRNNEKEMEDYDDLGVEDRNNEKEMEDYDDLGVEDRNNEKEMEDYDDLEVEDRNNEKEVEAYIEEETVEFNDEELEDYNYEELEDFSNEEMDVSSEEEFSNGEEVELCAIDEDVNEYVARMEATAGSSRAKSVPLRPRDKDRAVADHRKSLKTKTGTVDTQASVKQAMSDKEQVEGVQRLVSLFFAQAPSGDLDPVMNYLIEEFSAFEAKHRAAMIAKLKLQLKQFFNSDEAKSKKRKR